MPHHFGMGKSTLPSIHNRRAQIEAEFGEPLSDVVAGFAELGSTRADAAGALEVSLNSFRTFCVAEQIHFPTANERRARGGYFDGEAEAIRRRRISRTRRTRAKQYSAHGRTMSLTDWAETAGINKSTLHKRITQQGLSMAQALAYSRT